MDKTKWNFVIECLMFLLLSALVGLGLLMRYVLIPARERWAKYGRNVELTLCGWDRHDWGALHFYLALILLGLLVLHIYLHWQMIVAMFRRLVAAPRTRTIMLWIFVLLCLLLIFFPFLVSPKVEEVGRGPGQGQGRRYSLVPEKRLIPSGEGQGRSLEGFPLKNGNRS
jgi:hypothetical protein